jgi:DNA polymerase-3 subunit delta'
MYSFDEIVGHENIIKHMENAFLRGKVSHAYIVEGEDGMGKKTLVKAFSKLLQCENPQGSRPCNHCPSCIQIESGNHPDIAYVRPTKKTGYGVTDVREQIVKDIKVRPYQSRYKIYIIEQAELMTIQAQNSILKTIEEPPEYGLFFLISSNSHKFLQTILSRSVKMSLKPINTERIEYYLIEQYGMNHGQARVYGSFSRGNLGKALILKDSESFTIQRQNMLKCLDIFINGKEYDIIEIVQLFEGVKTDILDNIDILISLARDILYYHSTQDIDNIIHKDIESEIIRLNQKLNPSRLIQLVYNSYTLINQLRLNVNYSLAVTVMLTNIEH